MNYRSRVSPLIRFLERLGNGEINLEVSSKRVRNPKSESGRNGKMGVSVAVYSGRHRLGRLEFYEDKEILYNGRIPGIYRTLIRDNSLGGKKGPGRPDESVSLRWVADEPAIPGNHHPHRRDCWDKIPFVE